MKRSGTNLLAKPIVDSAKEKLIHVLYVDDEVGLLNAAKPILEMQGPFSVQTASSVEQATQKMKENQFDVIISDYQMPQENGLDFLKKLRENGNNIPFILFTGKGREEVAIKALNLGADRYFNKIGDPATVYGELAYGIRSAVRTKSAEEELRTFKTIADKAGYGVMLFDLKGNTLYVNESCAKMHGYDVNELVGKPHSLLHEKNSQSCVESAKGELFRKGYVAMEAQHLTKDGSIIPILINATIIKDTKGSPLYIATVITDITEQVTAREQLQRKTEDLSLINSINDSINRSDSLHDVIKLLANETKKLFDCSGATVYLLSEDKKSLIMQNLVLSPSTKGKIEKLLGTKIPQIRIPLDSDSLYFQIITKCESQLINDPAAIRNLTSEFTKTVNIPKKFRLFFKKLIPQIHRILGVKSVMIVPLVSDDSPIGLVDISSKKAFTVADLERFKEVLKPLTVAINRKHTEEQLKESEERYRKQFETAMDTIILAEAETGLIIDCNRAATEMFGKSKSELIGKHQRTLHPPRELSGKFSPGFKKHAKDGGGQVLEEQVTAKDGEIRDVLINATSFELEGRKVLQGTFHDITNRKKTEEALRASEKMHRELINGMNDTAWVIDSDCSFIDVNDAAVRVLGYSREELRSMKVFDIDVTLDPKEITNLVKGMPKDEVQVFQTAHTTKDGKTIPVEISSSLITYQGKQAVLSIARDITDRKKAEEELVRLSSAVKTSTDAIIITDLITKIIDTNEAALKMYGAGDKTDLVGKSSFDILVPEDREKALVNMKETLEKGYDKSQEYHILTKDGSRLPVEMSVAIMKAPDGKPVGFVGIARDVTERKRMENALRESEERFRQVVENSGEWVWEVDAKGLYKYASPVVEKLLGYKPEELVGKKHFYDMFHPEDKQELKKISLQAFAAKASFRDFTNRNIHKNGDTIWLSTSGVPVLDEKGNFLGYRGSDTDITERKRAEVALRESERRFRELSELLPEVVFEMDATGTITFVNNAGYEKFGYSHADFDKGLNALQMVAPEDRKRVQENIARVLGGELLGSTEYTGLRKDGSRFSLMTNTNPVMHGNKPAGLRGVIVDITERKKAEQKLERVMDNLMTINEKLGVVGRLTRHDVRNKLSVIANNVYLTKQSLTPNHNSLEQLGDIESAIGQIEEIFDFARTYEMLGVEDLTYMKVEKTVNEAIAMFSGLNVVKVVNECRGLTVMADSLLRTLIYNLIDNTLKYGEKVTQIRVYYTEEKECLKLIYDDDGVGIAEKEKEKIFEEGYGKGTGYGLYLIKKICEEYSWTIEETGKLGKGAQFTMVIPKMNKLGKKSYILK